MKSCLIVIDVQESFRHRPYFDAAALSTYLASQNALITAAQADQVPVVRVLHADEPDTPDNPFSHASGLVRPLDGLVPFEAALTVHKARHSALVGTGLDVWLVQHGIGRVVISGIRTEQCCETTTRHASDLGWEVDFVTDATLTFDMHDAQGGLLTADAIRHRTATVLDGRFAQVCTVGEAVARWQPA